MVGSTAAARLLRPPPPRRSVAPPTDIGPIAIPSIRLVIRFGATRDRPFSSAVLRRSAAAATGAVVGGGAEGAREGAVSVEGYRTADEIKAALSDSLRGINRGIFGVQSVKKSEIEGLVKLLESQNPTPEPTDHLDQVDGCWKLVYSTITILGIKRTKLGLRDFVALGDFFQTIDVAQGKAINEIQFSVGGFKMLSGQLTVVTSFKVSSKTRVDIRFESSDIAPDQLMNLFQKNYDLLLAIFNPEGWLEITYVDESLRIGRDDKGNIFVLERRTKEEKA